MASLNRFLTMMLAAASLLCTVSTSQAQELFHNKSGSTPRWLTLENPAGTKGRGGMENRGAKGNPADPFPAGAAMTVVDIKGAGVIRHIWLTIPERDPQTLRSVRIDMYWDGADKPAVSVPLGDFFGAILGRAVPLETELFTNPEGRSFNSYVPMPFSKSARVVVTNEGKKDLHSLYFQFDVEMLEKPDPKALYFHAFWHRVGHTELGKDFEILPRVEGEGRFLGTHIGVIGPKEYLGWWGEGEVKMFIDGDTTYPTLVGTGTEDYIGTGWGQGLYQNRFQGSVVKDMENRQWAFYRHHVPDPIYFRKDLRVTIQQMGGSEKKDVVQMLNDGVEVKPVTVHWGNNFTKLLEGTSPIDLRTHPSGPDDWVNFYRRDDVSAVAFFYLNRPKTELPVLAPVAERIVGLLEPKKD